MPLEPFKSAQALTMGVELELQLVNPTDFDLSSSASDMLHLLGRGRFPGDVKPEMTESMIEVSTDVHTRHGPLLAQLRQMRDALVAAGDRLNVGLCGGGTHPFQRWFHQRIFSKPRFHELSSLYGYLAKQFTVFGQHIHVGCTSADEAIWLTQALGVHVPAFIALSASSPFVDGVDSFYQSARLNAVSAFPLSGQCPPLNDWPDFCRHFEFLQACGIAQGIKDLYWDVRPKPEFGTVEIRVCDTPLSIEQAIALAAFAQSLARWLLRTRPPLHTDRQAHVARYNKFQACRFGLDAEISDPVGLCQQPLRQTLAPLLEAISEDASALGCLHWLNPLKNQLAEGSGDAAWLRERFREQGNLNDVVREASERLMR